MKPVHLIVDGYNMIRRLRGLAQAEEVSLAAGRERLISLLAHYKKIKRHKITVVFDGVLNMSEFSPEFQQAGVGVRFSAGNKADEVIIDLVRGMGPQATVVSSDSELRGVVEGLGAVSIACEDFYDRLLQAQAMLGFAPERDEQPPQHLHKRWATYKKGPSKRLPKRERRQRQRLEKL